MDKLLVLIINDMVIFPNNEVRIEYDNNYDKQMVDIVDKIDDNLMLIVNPIDESNIDVTSFPKYGVLGRLKLKINVPNGKTRIVIEGIERVEISSIEEEGHYFRADYKEVEIVEEEDSKKYFDILVKSLENYISKAPYMGNAILGQLNGIDELNDLCDLIASFLPIKYEDKKKYVTTISPIQRAKYLIEDMNRDLKFVELEQRIEAEVDKELNETQKEYFLREKIKLMQKEIGEGNDKDSEVERLRKKASKLKCNAKVRERIKRELERYDTLNSNSPELGMINEYLDWMINLPWNHYTKDTDDLNKVKSILDSSHYAFGTPYYLLPELASHDITSVIADNGYYVLLALAQGIGIDETLPEGVTVTPLLTSSVHGYIKDPEALTLEYEDGDETGAITLAVAVTNDLQSSKMMVIGTSTILDESANQMVSGGNEDFFLNTIEWMSAGENGMGDYTIHAKALESEYLTVSEKAGGLLKIVMIGLIPVLFLALGIVITVKRRRR